MIWGGLLVSAFIGGWVGFAIAAGKRGWSKIVGIGGGFVIGCLSLLAVGIVGFIVDKQPTAPAVERQPVPAPAVVAPPPTTVVPPSVAVANKPGLGISYKQMMRDLDEFFPKMEDSVLATGEKRKMGSSKTAILEVIGDSPDEVNRVSISFFAVSDSDLMNAVTLAIVTQVASNAFPDWPGAGKKILEGLEKVANRKPEPGKLNAMQHIHGDKAIKVSLVKEVGLFAVTISPKEAKK